MYLQYLLSHATLDSGWLLFYVAQETDSIRDVRQDIKARAFLVDSIVLDVKN